MSEHHQSQATDHQKDSPVPTPIMKKRRGRQPRQSLVTSKLQEAIVLHTSHIGAPIFQKEGFRDFTGWLTHIRKAEYRHSWNSLCQEFYEAYTTTCDNIVAAGEDKAAYYSNLKKDVVQEVIKLVVKRQPGESAKLVNTNARRQCAIPTNGMSFMIIFNMYLFEFCGLRPSMESSSSGNGSGGSGSSSGSGGGDRSSSYGRHGGRGGGSSRSRIDSGAPAPGSSSNGAAASSSSALNISALLTHDSHHHHHHHSSRSGHGRSSNKLPSLTQFEEEIRARSEQEKRSTR